MTFSLDGKFAYPSTGEVIDTKTKKIVAALKDEKGREVHSEKMVEIHFEDGVPVRAGDQFGVGRVKTAGRGTRRRQCGTWIGTQATPHSPPSQGLATLCTRPSYSP